MLTEAKSIWCMLNNFADAILERVHLYRTYRNEIKKIQDMCRVDIYSKVSLPKADKQAIDTLYEQNLGRKIPYTWHRHFTAFTSKFDKNYFPEILFIPRFERFLNLDRHYTQALSDKNFFYTFAQGVGVKIPKTLLSCVAGLMRNQNNEALSKDQAVALLSNIGKCLCKPTVDYCSGQGCFIADFNNGTDAENGKSVVELIDTLGDNFVVQERIACHKQVAKLHPNSCNTFRIMTYRWHDDFLLYQL